MTKKHKTLIRKSVHSIEEILNEIIILPDMHEHKRKKLKYCKNFDGDLIYMSSLRYEVFKKSLVCCKCGLKGSFFAKEKDCKSDRYHFNLYAINENGEEILMTKDHIIPKILGGSNNIENLQTMCTVCNGKKGCKIDE